MKQKGFTLVELSIVLVIIGLLIGGILAAQSMISTAKMQRIIRNLQQYEIAINNFKQNYNSYPGDSQSFTAPGNGDKAIVYSTPVPTPPYCNGIYGSWENRQAFAHLAEASMISGNYVPYQPKVLCNGSQNDDYYGVLAGIVAPYTEISSSTFGVLATTGYSFGYPANNKHSLTLNKDTDLSNAYIAFFVDPDYVIPLETKLGSGVSTSNSVGLANTQGVGQCIYSNSQKYPCNDTTHGPLAGVLYYYIDLNN